MDIADARVVNADRDLGGMWPAEAESDREGTAATWWTLISPTA